MTTQTLTKKGKKTELVIDSKKKFPQFRLTNAVIARAFFIIIHRTCHFLLHIIPKNTYG